MRLGIDISQIVYKGTGVARFTEGLVNAILEYDVENEWTFFFSGFRQKLSRDLKKRILARHRLLEWSFPPKGLSLLFNDWHSLGVVPKELRKLDFFITSDWAEPKLKGVKKATVVHDLAFKRYPETIEKNILKTQLLRFELLSRESDLIFTDSVATKNDLLNYYKIKKAKVVTNYPGVEISGKIKKNPSKKPYILTVGKLEPRKNLERLVGSFNRMADANIDLYIVGPKGWQELGKEFEKPNIKIMDFVADEKLYSLYANCLFFIYPSLWEGFGIPVIEAMKMGAPVACSSTSSIAEVAGDAALTFDPLKEKEIHDAMVRLKNDAKLREALSKKGIKNAEKFTWANYYDKMMKSINETLRDSV